MRRLPAEFEKQSFIQVIFPHKNSDWAEYLEEAEANFINIINAIASYQNCLLICHDTAYVRSRFNNHHNIHFVQAPTNDTWSRDCSAISVYEDNIPLLLDFKFTAWGGKFEAGLDNSLTQSLSSNYDTSIKHMDFILEGGAIESNGKGTLLITSECVFNSNRNPLPREKSEDILKTSFGVTHILSLEHGYLRGDDTDSHIDTLARFVDESTIVYLACDDPEDEHYTQLHAMEKELKSFKDQDGNPFTLVSLPFTDPIYDGGERLPATYANFLILNEAVLVPVYQDPHDEEALKILKELFPQRIIVPINCSTLIRQHGSLHCVTMHFPHGINIKT